MKNEPCSKKHSKVRFSINSYLGVFLNLQTGKLRKEKPALVKWAIGFGQIFYYSLTTTNC
jgi:hypothetical protein